MKILVDDHKNGGRKVVDATLVKDRGTTIEVKLANGDVISRKKKRDIPKEVL